MSKMIKGVSLAGNIATSPTRPSKPSKKRPASGTTPQQARDEREEQEEAILRLRQTVGTFLYLGEKKVDEILVKQVDRIGEQLENIENALVKKPRKEKRKGPLNPATNAAPDYEVTFDAWKKMDLKAAWFGYMDDIYKNRKAVAWKEMDKLIGWFNDMFTKSKLDKLKGDIKKEENEKNPNKDALKTMKEEQAYQELMRRNIDKVETEWKKARDWKKPGWNSKSTPAKPASP